MSTCTAIKGSSKADRKRLAKQQPSRWTSFREFDFRQARHNHGIATISIDLALWNGIRPRNDRQQDLADYFKAKAEYKAILLKIKADRLIYQASGNKRSIWRPVGGDSRRLASLPMQPL